MSTADQIIGGGTYVSLDRFLGYLEAACAVIAACMMLFAMVSVTLDSVARYVFNAPFENQFYLTEHYLLIGMITMAMPWGFRTGGYIRIMSIVGQLGSSLRAVLLRLGLLLSAAYVGTLAWTGGEHFLEAYLKNESHMGTSFNWPVAWSWVWVPVGCGLLAFRLLLTAFGPTGSLHVEHDLLTEDAI
jgi:TRAP-type C4-dicarboxylate transport system permease small subunit